MTQKIKSWFAALLVAGCAAGPQATFTGQETPDSRYRALPMNFSGGQQVTVRYRVYDDRGKAALCGYLTGEGGYVDRDITELWFQEATLLLNDAEFSKADFLKFQWGAAAPRAGCVPSALAWVPAMSGARLGFRGGAVRRVY